MQLLGAPATQEEPLDVIRERCAGLAVHHATVAAGLRLPGARRERAQVIQTVGTIPPDLLALRDWRAAYQVTHVAMESTGVSWKPGDAVTLLLVKAAYLAQVPGRKTDVADGAWIAQLRAGGLLRGSVGPPPASRERRDLPRDRQALRQDRTREANRLPTGLQDAGIQLAPVATDILGVSGRALRTALAAGTTAPTVRAALARGKLRSNLPVLQRALTGRFRGPHAFLVTPLLAPLA